MAENIRLEIVTPEKTVVSEDAQMVVSPGANGDFGVLVGHTPFLTTLKLGTIRYIDKNKKERYIFVSGGFAETLPDRVTVLAESAERRVDIDVERAQAAIDRAQKRLVEKNEKIKFDMDRNNVALQRALHRIKLAGTR